MFWTLCLLHFLSGAASTRRWCWWRWASKTSQEHNKRLVWRLQCQKFIAVPEIDVSVVHRCLHWVCLSFSWHSLCAYFSEVGGNQPCPAGAYCCWDASTAAFFFRKFGYGHCEKVNEHANCVGLSRSLFSSASQRRNRVTENRGAVVQRMPEIFTQDCVANTTNLNTEPSHPTGSTHQDSITGAWVVCISRV